MLCVVKTSDIAMKWRRPQSESTSAGLTVRESERSCQTVPALIRIAQSVTWSTRTICQRTNRQTDRQTNIQTDIFSYSKPGGIEHIRFYIQHLIWPPGHLFSEANTGSWWPSERESDQVDLVDGKTKLWGWGGGFNKMSFFNLCSVFLS